MGPVENPVGQAHADRPLHVEAARRLAHEGPPAVVAEPHPVLGHAGAVAAKMRAGELSEPRPADEAHDTPQRCNPRGRQAAFSASR